MSCLPTWLTKFYPLSSGAPYKHLVLLYLDFKTFCRNRVLTFIELHPKLIKLLNLFLFVDKIGFGSFLFPQNARFPKSVQL